MSAANKVRIDGKYAAATHRGCFVSFWTQSALRTSKLQIKLSEIEGLIKLYASYVARIDIALTETPY